MDKLIYESMNQIEGQMLQQVLQDNGVHSTITGLAQSDGRLAIEIKIFVSESDYEKAEELKEAFFKA